MNLIKLTLQKADRGLEVRYATSDQRVEEIIAKYLLAIPGAICAFQSVDRKNIDETMRRKVALIQSLDFFALDLVLGDSMALDQ